MRFVNLKQFTNGLTKEDAASTREWFLLQIGHRL